MDLTGTRLVSLWLSQRRSAVTLRPRLAHHRCRLPVGVGSALKPPLCGGVSGEVKEKF
ncbi:hypothetical protein [Mailhella sp.]